MDSPERTDLSEDMLADVIDQATRLHERVAGGLRDLLIHVAGACEAPRTPVPVTAPDRAPRMSTTA
jgi:hypothetical protein